MAKYTLISSLGTGMYRGGEYQQTNYVFPDGQIITDSLFFRAVLNAKYRDISQIIIVGTRTSSWDILVNQADADFWFRINEQCGHSGISDDNLKEIEQRLSVELNIPIILAAHNSKVDGDTCNELFHFYSTLTEKCDSANKILLDITHGFRSMPILMYQALQFGATAGHLSDAELIYGEFIKEESKSFVRNLSEYWKLSEITKMSNQFQTKLDGFEIAEALTPYWEAGAKVTDRLSKIVSLNYSLQIKEVLNQIKNALHDDLSQTPEWVRVHADYLGQIYTRLNAPTMTEILFRYAQFLTEKHLYTQSVIALQVCVETAIAELICHRSEKEYGDYDWWDKIGKKLKNKTLPNNVKSKLATLERFRNSIAHGGAKGKKSDAFPSTDNIERMTKISMEAVKNMLDWIKDNPIHIVNQDT